MTADTTVLSYWLNWRFFICAIFVFSSIILSSVLIWRNEGCRRSKRDRREHDRYSQQTLYLDEAWNTCMKGIHPFWLLVFRALGFMVLLALILANAIVDGVGIFYFYTQWTFTLVTIYFGLALSSSIYGCCQYQETSAIWDNHLSIDTEGGSYRPPTLYRTIDEPKTSNFYGEASARRTVAGVWGYTFQIIFQTCAGAVVLTDSVFWFIIYPFLTAKDFNLNFFIFCMHSVNAVFLLGETMLNSLRFPLFRIAYFVLWTSIFVVFQWIIHACVRLWWPYPFLDLSSPYAPLWYAAVGLMHIPCYGLFALIIKLKNSWLSRSFSESHQICR